MTTKDYNRVRILYNTEHMPFLYGVIHIVSGNLENQRWEHPFVVSKRMPHGREIVYGTVKRTLEKISSQVDRLKHFHSETKATLDAEGITPLIREKLKLPESEMTDRILDDQENLIEEVLLTVSVNIRILSEIFPQKLKRSKVNVYDYDDVSVDRIELSEIANLLLHNRYILVKDNFVVDLLSDQKFMAAKPQMGLKINFSEYILEVQKVVNSITVKDLITKLCGLTTKLSASSNIKEIIFLTQNLYTLGDFVLEKDVPLGLGPLKTILDRIVMKHNERMYPQHSASDDKVFLSTPRFHLEPDLDRKLIRIEMLVNDKTENLVIGYKELFRSVSKASGNRKLFKNTVG